MNGKLAAGLCVLCFCVSIVRAADKPVKAWEDQIVIPTYPAGPPEEDPMFYFGRQSQGAQGPVYPYPLYDVLTDKKVDQTYKVVYLENEYVRISILPEIGGRILGATDKTNNYNFIYQQHVIKPALIGLIGAWMSGGVEWNIPHHHRASTFLPVQYRIEENGDGSKTVWIGELELRQRMRWAVGYTLRPGKSYLEAAVRIVNRTPVVNTMLCFANVAVHADDDYQIIFPPSTQYGVYHAKREFISWPIADQRYAGADFRGGVDVSWYKNQHWPNSIFAWNYQDDFFAGYDHGKEAGTMSIADHHIVPGKKFWTWGNGPRGKMWDRILTDDDGPYIELMVGSYSDNQPDYSWLQPYEEKSFSEFWYPFRDIGSVKNANLDAAVNLEMVDKGNVKVGFYTTAVHAAAQVNLKAGTQVLLDEAVAIDPGKPFVRTIAMPVGVDEHDLVASISDGGKELVSYTPVRLEKMEVPEAVTPPPAPGEIKTNEELYLTGLRAEQFHSPSVDPMVYWEEALRRDPGDVRVNTVLGIDCFKQAKYSEAEKYLRTALGRATDKYTTPKDAEATYYLGLTLKAQGRVDEAYDTFYKATWNLAWRGAGYYSIGEIVAMRGDMAHALEFADDSLLANGLNIRAMTLKAAALRHLGKSEEALVALEQARKISDPLDGRVMAEKWLLQGGEDDAAEMVGTMRQFPAVACETAAEYLDAGLWEDGLNVLNRVIVGSGKETPRNPMVYYYLGYFYLKLDQPEKASEAFRIASALPADYVFPFQNEAIDVLSAAMEINRRDARAPYYLGNLLFDWQPDVAMGLWEQSANLDPKFGIVLRNLAIGYSHQKTGNSLDKAIGYLEQAVGLDHKYAAHFAELDELYAASGAPVDKRLALFEKNEDVVSESDDAVQHEITLKVLSGKYDDALKLAVSRRFNIWEGGTLTVVDSWIDAHLLRGREELAAGKNQLCRWRIFRRRRFFRRLFRRMGRRWVERRRWITGRAWRGWRWGRKIRRMFAGRRRRLGRQRVRVAVREERGVVGIVPVTTGRWR